MTDSTAEFTLTHTLETDRRSPVRWVISHALHQWPTITVALIGAFGNAALMAVTATQIGRAFNVVSAPNPDLKVLLSIAVLIAIANVGRGLLQFTRNFGFEYAAQRVERDVREELYSNLLGKSMTFHGLQPVGDTMARATNDVREVNFLFSPGLSQVVGSLNFLIFPFSWHPPTIRRCWLPPLSLPSSSSSC